MGKLFKTLAITLTFFVCLSLFVFPVKASDWTVNVLVAYDEEWADTAQWFYWYSPEYLAAIILWEVAYRFDSQFSIWLDPQYYISWDSNDNPASGEAMLREAVNEIGFYSGMTFSGYPIHMLVVFTGQDIPNIYGGAGKPGTDLYGAVLVQHFYTYAAGQHTDNILQHELSHLYGADDHDVNGLDCVMNNFGVPIGFPEYMEVPTALLTDNWCEDCKSVINQNRGSWGWCPGGCPILSVYDGEYVEEGLLNIHNPEGIDVVYQHTLVTTPQRVNGAYWLRLTEHHQTHSYMDEVNLYAILEDGTNIKLPLVYACHSEDGNVLPQLLHSDDWKADTLGAELNNGTSQSIDLKFASLSPNLEIVGFMFEIEGNNMILKR